MKNKTIRIYAFGFLALIVVVALSCTTKNSLSGYLGGLLGSSSTTTSGPSPTPTTSPATPNPTASPTAIPSGTPYNGTDNSVTQHHKQSTRAGLFIDPAFTQTAAANTQLDKNFVGTVNGNVFAQPLFFDAQGVGTDLIIVATENNHVTALNAQTGTVVWDKTFGAPVSGTSSHGCGNVDPLGITGTPALDVSTHTIYFDAYSGLKHSVYAISLDDGSTRAGWPLSVDKVVSGFASLYQNQRSALLLLNGTLFVAYGGHWGDCGSYHGWVIAVPTSNPAGATGWHTGGNEGGIWAHSGVASDGQSVFFATGNTGGVSQWSQGEAVIRLSPSLQFSNSTSDYFAPTNWAELDSTDKDLGAAGVMLFEMPSLTTPHLALSLGKDGFARLLNRNNLGGIGHALFTQCITNCSPVGSAVEIQSASTAFSTAGNTYVSFNSRTFGDSASASVCPAGQSGEIVTMKVTPTNPPTLVTAWCATQNGYGAPISTAVDSNGSQAMVWSLGAEGDNKLYGFDGISGQKIAAVGGASTIQHFLSPVVAKGHVYVGANGRVFSYIVK